MIVRMNGKQRVGAWQKSERPGPLLDELEVVAAVARPGGPGEPCGGRAVPGAI